MSNKLEVRCVKDLLPGDAIVWIDHLVLVIQVMWLIPNIRKTLIVVSRGKIKQPHFSVNWEFWCLPRET